MIYGWAAFLVLLVLWGFAWHYQTKLAFGILIGLGVGVALSGFIGPFDSIQDIPLWLPATPLISIVIILLVLGVLAWRVPPSNTPTSGDRH